MTSIRLAWPPATLSGHAGGHWRDKASPTAKHREWARLATLDARVPRQAPTGDIPMHVIFYPPDNRGDRVNYPNRLKPAWDGIAEAMGVNDRRFLPSYQFCDPVRDARVVVVVGGVV